MMGANLEDICRKAGECRSNLDMTADVVEKKSKRDGKRAAKLNWRTEFCSDERRDEKVCVGNEQRISIVQNGAEVAQNERISPKKEQLVKRMAK